MRTLNQALAPLEEAISKKFLPALFGDTTPISDVDRSLYALPTKHGGLSIDNPISQAPLAYDASTTLTADLQKMILLSESNLGGAEAKMKTIKAEISRRNEKQQKEEAGAILRKLPHETRRGVECASQKGASAIFSALPLENLGFCFKGKQDFRDLVRMRYRKVIKLPTTCGCGQPYSLDHSQICKVGGLIHMRHDGPKKLFARVAREVFHDVEVEPVLTELTGEVMDLKSANTKPDARADVRIKSFYTEKQNAFFDFRGFYPFAKSFSNATTDAAFESVAKAKRREYGQRIAQVENGSFIPMVFASTGGMGKEMQTAIGHLARKLSEKRKQPYSVVVGWLRAQFSFEFAWSALICLRGSRSRRVNTDDLPHDTPPDVGLVSANLNM